MLTRYAQPQFIERIIADNFGRQFRVKFAVVEVGGEFKAKIVSVEPIASLKGEVSSGNRTLYLPCAKSSFSILLSTFSCEANVTSPYFSNDFLIKTQPTRAPSAR